MKMKINSGISPPMRIPFAFALLLRTRAPAPAASAHGTERHFGTPINGRATVAPEANAGGSPAFTLLVLATNAEAIERAIDEGRVSEARERAHRLLDLIRELELRSRNLAAPARELAAEVASAIAERGTRIATTARTSDLTSIRHDLAELRRLVASMQDILQKTPER